MQFRAALVLGSIVVLSACGETVEPQHECSLEQPPTSTVCDEPLARAVEACSAATPADPGCETRACLDARSRCVAEALAEAQSCASCWGCEQAETMRGCQVECETGFRSCLDGAAGSADVERCESAAFECGLRCGAVTAAIPAGCR